MHPSGASGMLRPIDPKHKPPGLADPVPLGDTKGAEMEQRITAVTLGVADLERSETFYRALGWERVNDDAEVAFFQAWARRYRRTPRLKTSLPSQASNISSTARPFS